MFNPITRVAGKAVDVAMFGVGLVEGTVRGVAARVLPQRTMPDQRTTQQESDQRSEPLGEPGAERTAEPAASAAETFPEPREVPKPTPPRRPTPDPYDVDVTTPVGTTGAGPAYNPDTAESDLQQPGTEPIMDPSTTKKIKAETDILRKAAERNPE